MMAISDEIRARIIGLSEGGFTGVQIAATTGVPIRTVTRLVKTFRKDGTYKRKPCGGSHAKKLSDRDVRAIIRVSKTHRCSTLSEITNICSTQVSRSTIRRALHESGIFSRIVVKKPFLTHRHMSQRLAFAQKYCGWTIKEWERVVWTDESTFEVGIFLKSGRTSLMI